MTHIVDVDAELQCNVSNFLYHTQIQHASVAWKKVIDIIVLALNNENFDTCICNKLW